MRAFNESLICIFEFDYHNSPVLNFKLYSSSSNEPGFNQIDPTVFVQYEEFCVKIDALQLIATLGQNEKRLQTDQSLNNHVFYECWYLRRTFNDFIYCGRMFESTYDHLVQQSLFTQDTSFKLKDQRTIKRDLLVATGSESFLSFYDLNKNDSEVTIKGAMMSLMNSYLFGSSKDDQPKFSSNKGTLFFNLNKQSTGNLIVLSPNRSLALVQDHSDSLPDDQTEGKSEEQKNGCVSLVDLRRREVIRTWRGYRNCQFAFIEVTNPLNTERALFVCLYLPDSKTVEIWPSRFDDRIVSLEVGSNCVLLNSQSLFKAKTTAAAPAGPSALLIDFDTFTCHTFDVSFLCAVNDYRINSRDDLLLKEIPRTINNSQFRREYLMPILRKLTSPENKLAALKMMFEKNDLGLIEYTIASFRSQQSSDWSTPEKAPTTEEQALLLNCRFISELIEVFTQMNERNRKIENFVIPKNILKETPQNIAEETEHLKWKDTDFTRIIPLFIFSEHLNPDDLHFQLPALSVQEFLGAFNFGLASSTAKRCNVNLKQTDALHKLSSFLFSYLVLEDQDLKIINFYLAHSISALDLIYLLFHAWSTNAFTYNWKTWKVLLLIAYYLVEEYRTEIDHEPLFRRNLIGCLKQACRLFLASSFIQSAIVGTYTIQVIYNLFCKKDKQTTEYVESEWDEWVEISLDEESFSSVLKQLEDIYLLNLLLQCGNSDPDQQISLIKLVNSKNSLTGELVAVHCVRNLIDASVISNLNRREEEEEENKIKIESNFKTEIDKHLRMLDETDEDLFGQLLRHVQLRFPCNLNTSVLLSHCAWQSIAKFVNNPSIANQVHLAQCLNYLNQINDPVLKHKMALLIWKAFIAEKFSKINRIIFHEGAWNTYSFDELGIEEITLEPFVSFISNFAEFIFNTINDAMQGSQIDYKKDDWWMPKKSKILTGEDQQKSIIEVAQSLRIAKHNITLIHSQLALLSSLTINYKENTITSLKTCFPQTVTSLLYGDLHIDLNLDDDNEHLKKCRKSILRKFTQNVGRSVPIVTSKIPNDQERVGFREANSWISKLIDLAQDWNIDSKLVKTNYAFVLYLIGCDVLAKEGGVQTLEK